MVMATKVHVSKQMPRGTACAADMRKGRGEGACYDALGRLTVPVVDLSKSEEECARVAKEACEKLGFFYLAGHDVPQQLMDDILKAAKAFFSKSSDEKEKFRANEEFIPLGYKHSANDETLTDPKSQKFPDQREHYRLCNHKTFKNFQEVIGKTAPNACGQDDNMIYICEEELKESWKATVEEYFGKVISMIPKLHRVLALSLGLEADYFKEYFANAMDFMIFHRYFANSTKIGLGQHTDFGMATVLLTNGVPGLQVCVDKSKPNHAREWIDVPQKDGMFIVNIGDALERWANGRYLSNLHRVVNQGGQERISCALFRDPNASSIITPFAKDGEKKYEDVLFGEHLKKRFQDISEKI